MGPIEKEVRRRLEENFGPSHLELENESHAHRVPANAETHFRLILVSPLFRGLSRIARQRMVNDCLRDLLVPNSIHALTQKTLTPEEWTEAGGQANDFTSPLCVNKGRSQ